MIGMGSRAMNSGMMNHLLRTVRLTSGVATEIKPMPSTTGAQAFLAHSTAWRCKSPSVFMMSQAAPNSTYAAGSSSAMTAAKSWYSQLCSKPVM